MVSGQKMIFYLFSLIVPIVGICLGVVWMNEREVDKMKVGKNHLILGVASIVLSCIGLYAFSDKLI